MASQARRASTHSVKSRASATEDLLLRGGSQDELTLSSDLDAFVANELANFDLEQQASKDKLRGQGSAEDNRSRSPVIVWRPSVRVRLATDLPEELFEDELEEVNSALEMPGLLARRLPPLEADGGRAYTSLTARPQWNAPGNRKREQVHPRYGAWYIPAKDWGVNAWPTRRGWDETEPSTVRSKKEIKHAEESQRGLNEYQELLESQIANLYSSRAYKDYIKATGDRIPHYLHCVDSGRKDDASLNGDKAGKDAVVIHNFLQNPFSKEAQEKKAEEAAKRKASTAGLAISDRRMSKMGNSLTDRGPRAQMRSNSGNAYNRAGARSPPNSSQGTRSTKFQDPRAPPPRRGRSSQGPRTNRLY
mmetsp:Transcript_39677/g.48137  ORF Transcript_39677/g.48137 Transcript_39677/m.48137 type:complete len:362 (+) Transcript_39677:192-1277(+)